MILLLLVAMLLAIPGLLIAGVWRARHPARIEWALGAAVAAAYLLYVVLAGRWDWFGYGLRMLLPALLVVALVRGGRRVRHRPWTRRLRARDLPGLLVMVGLLGLFVYADVRALGGRSHPGQAVPLAFPLRQGVYYVGGGGADRVINNHQAYPPQAYALDVVRLNGFGMRARGFQPRALERYTIFGDTVFAPCTGRVARAQDGLPDLPIGRRDPEHLAGNHLVLRCGDAKVLLAHLLRGSVRVRTGTPVQQGQPLGRVGNSGNTSEPHLHIHTERGGSPAGILDGTGTPMRFDGRFLVRNSLVWRRLGSRGPAA